MKKILCKVNKTLGHLNWKYTLAKKLLPENIESILH